MTGQFIFLVTLHALGILFALPLRKSLPMPFIWLSGVLWGALFYVLGSIAILVIGIPYQRLPLALTFGLFAASLVAWNLRKGSLSFTPAERRSGLAWTSIPLLIFALSSGMNFTFISPDSLDLMLNGRAFAIDGFSAYVRSQLALRGVFVQALQAASPLLAQDYLYALQPAFTLVSAALFVYLGWLILKQTTPEDPAEDPAGHPAGHPAAWPFVAGLLGLAGTYLIAFQAVYLHTNLLSGCYLMVGLACFWLALREKNHHWLVFGVLSMTSFSLLRNEAPLFALLFFALLISYQEIPYRVRLAASLPFCLFLIGWYLYLLAGVGNSYILTPANILLMVLALAGFASLAVASRLKWVETWVLARLPWLLLLGALGLCFVLYMRDPARARDFFEALLLNMTVHGLWGVTWFLVIAAWALTLALPAIPYQRIFAFGIPVFLILLFAVSTQNTVHKLDWSDSSNRMLSHILPTIFLYGCVRFSHAFTIPAIDVETLRKSRSPLLIALGSSILVFIIALILTR